MLKIGNRTVRGWSELIIMDYWILWAVATCTQTQGSESWKYSLRFIQSQVTSRSLPNPTADRTETEGAKPKEERLGRRWLSDSPLHSLSQPVLKHRCVGTVSRSSVWVIRVPCKTGASGAGLLNSFIKIESTLPLISFSISPFSLCFFHFIPFCLSLYLIYKVRVTQLMCVKRCATMWYCAYDYCPFSFWWNHKGQSRFIHDSDKIIL